MYEPDNTESLYRIKDANGIHQVSMDIETYAHSLNNPDIEVLEELMVIHRRRDEEEVVQALLQSHSTGMVYPMIHKEGL